MIKSPFIHPFGSSNKIINCTFYSNVIMMKLRLDSDCVEKYERMCLLANTDFIKEKYTYKMSINTYEYFKRILPIMIKDFPNDKFLDKEHLRTYKDFLK